jgi:hypothetical protein
MEDDVMMEDAIFPWLASDCMADPTLEPDFFDECSEFEDSEDFE